MPRPTSSTSLRAGGENVFTAYGYDTRGNRTFVRDPNGNVTRYEYDLANRLKKIYRPGDLTPGLAYGYEDDPATHVQRTTAIDAKGQRIVSTHDAMGRLAKTEHFGPHAELRKTVDYARNELGSLTRFTQTDPATGESVTGDFTYDDRQRKTAETIGYGPFAKGFGYTYYANGRKKTFTDPQSGAYEYLYDENNRLTEIRSAAMGTAATSSFQWNRPTEVHLPGGGTKTYAYDALLRPQEIQAKDPSGHPVSTITYPEYFPSGNVQTKIVGAESLTYGYDELYRLTSVTASNPTRNETFTYDPNGNRKTQNGGPEWHYDPQGKNEIRSTPDAIFTHDPNGNLETKTQAGTTTKYEYDSENRLVRVLDCGADPSCTQPTPIAGYGYDPFARRLWKEVGGVRTYYAYTDEGVLIR